MTAPIATPLTVRSIEDLLALVPVVLGFAPTESIVMLTFGAPRAFHARCDLPASAADLPAATEQLLEPVLVHGVSCVILIVYSADERRATEAAWSLCGSFARADVRVLEAIRTDGRCWFPALGQRTGVPADGVPYDVSAHPFRAQAVVEGRVVHVSRDGLRETLASDPRRVAAVVGALADLTGGPPGARRSAAEAAWADELVRRHVRAGPIGRLRDGEVVRLLRGLLEIPVRDAAASSLTPSTASAHIDLWTDVVRRTPAPMLAAPAALLALAAWQAGQGALAWCALDRCAEADEHYPLAALVAQALEQAVPPPEWDDPDES